MWRIKMEDKYFHGVEVGRKLEFEKIHNKWIELIGKDLTDFEMCAEFTRFMIDREEKLKSAVKKSLDTNRYEVYGDITTPIEEETHIELHDEVVEEIKNRNDYEEHSGTIDELKGLKIHTSGGDVILKEKYRSELERKNIKYEEVKK